MPDLFPDAISQDVGTEDDVDNGFIGYKAAPYFDGKDFARDGAHRVVIANGATAWAQWCEKCLATQKGASPYYPAWYGVDWKNALASGDRDLTENILSREISDTLKSDQYGRLDHVESIDYSWTGTSLDVSVAAVGIDGSTATIAISKEVT
jgi:hypothetical protein